MRPAERVEAALLAAVPGSTAGSGWVCLPNGVVVTVRDRVPAEVVVRGAADARGGEVRVLVGEGDGDEVLAPVVDAARWWAGRLTLRSLAPGVEVRVLARFADEGANWFEPGERLTIQEHVVNAYHEGHTIRCGARSLYIQERTPLEDQLDLLLALVERT